MTGYRGDTDVSLVYFDLTNEDAEGFGRQSRHGFWGPRVRKKGEPREGGRQASLESRGKREK